MITFAIMKKILQAIGGIVKPNLPGVSIATEWKEAKKNKNWFRFALYALAALVGIIVMANGWANFDQVLKAFSMLLGIA